MNEQRNVIQGLFLSLAEICSVFTGKQSQSCLNIINNKLDFIFFYLETMGKKSLLDVIAKVVMSVI